MHGVTGSSPVPRTMVKSPETTMVSGLFVILTKDAAGIIWKTLRKVAKTAFSVFSPRKKTGGLLERGDRLFLRFKDSPFCPSGT